MTGDGCPDGAPGPETGFGGPAGELTGAGGLATLGAAWGGAPGGLTALGEDAAAAEDGAAACGAGAGGATGGLTALGEDAGAAEDGAADDGAAEDGAAAFGAGGGGAPGPLTTFGDEAGAAEDGAAGETGGTAGFGAGGGGAPGPLFGDGDETGPGVDVLADGEMAGGFGGEFELAWPDGEATLRGAPGDVDAVLLLEAGA